MTIKELKQLIDEFEKDGKHCMGVHLPKNVAIEIQKELTNLYRFNQKDLTTIYGVEILSTNADIIKFEV
ncbi:MAG: hypothetical protein OEV44_15255 [Spirochaetota bacterium]|nr:hypothetical protein [Spirochaetota bacterium]